MADYHYWGEYGIPPPFYRLCHQAHVQKGTINTHYTPEMQLGKTAMVEPFQRFFCLMMIWVHTHTPTHIYIYTVYIYGMGEKPVFFPHLLGEGL
jgi:hypothetical protein